MGCAAKLKQYRNRSGIEKSDVFACSFFICCLLFGVGAFFFVTVSRMSESLCVKRKRLLSTTTKTHNNNPATDNYLELNLWLTLKNSLWLTIYVTVSAMAAGRRVNMTLHTGLRGVCAVWIMVSASSASASMRLDKFSPLTSCYHLTTTPSGFSLLLIQSRFCGGLAGLHSNACIFLTVWVLHDRVLRQEISCSGDQ